MRRAWKRGANLVRELLQLRDCARGSEQTTSGRRIEAPFFDKDTQSGANVSDGLVVAGPLRSKVEPLKRPFTGRCQLIYEEAECRIIARLGKGLKL